jgi:hypothetical protein
MDSFISNLLSLSHSEPLPFSCLVVFLSAAKRLIPFQLLIADYYTVRPGQHPGYTVTAFDGLCLPRRLEMPFGIYFVHKDRHVFGPASNWCLIRYHQGFKARCSGRDL